MTEPALLFVHAHPDDECILTGSILAKAASFGIRTLIAYGTKGDAGETSLDLRGETLGERRIREAELACADLGVDRIEWLPYDDSGMDGTDTTNNPAAFCNADPQAVVAQLIELFADENIVAVIGYDDNGTYGHPDHKQVHVVAHAAAEPLGAQWVLDATYNREYLATLPDADGTLDPDFAAGEADLTHYVDGDQWFEAKWTALMHHLSQHPDDVDFENPPIDDFKARFGTEWFIATATPAGAASEDLGLLGQVLEPKATWTG